MFFGLVMQMALIANIFNPCMLKHGHYLPECPVDLNENSLPTCN